MSGPQLTRKLSPVSAVGAKPLAALLTSLIPPLAFTAYVMAAWRLGADMNWLGDFVIARGLLSRWQVWLALAIAAQIGAHQINRARKTGAARRTDA